MRQALLLALALALAPAAHAQFFGGGGSKQADRVTFNLCNGSPCFTGVDQTNRYLVTAAGKVKKCYIAAKTPPSGAALIFDIKNAATGVSIFGAQPKLTLPAGQTTAATVAAFDNPSVAEGDLLRVDITQVGSVAPAQDVSAVCTIRQN